MRKTLLSVLVSLAFLFAALPNSEAIFGLGACEKLTKQMKAEEEIGIESWKYYRQQAALYNNNPSLNTFLAEAILEVYLSDLSAWTRASKQTKCFNAVQNAEIRRQLSYTKRSIADYKALIKSKDANYFVLIWSNYYSKYYRVHEILNKLNQKSNG